MAQWSNAGHTHNTSDQVITVLYPFHPLVGQRFLPVFVNQKPRRSFRVQLPERRLTIPAWMTEEPGAAIPHAGIRGGSVRVTGGSTLTANG